jgi:hypothetical protein
VKKAYPFLFLLGACAALSSDPGQTGQAEAARAGEEISCQRYLARLRAGAAEGLSCTAAKARAAAENPTCNLTFECGRHRDLDGGTE